MLHQQRTRNVECTFFFYPLHIQTQLTLKNVTDFLDCTHTGRGEVNLLFEHGLAHAGVVYGQASRGKIQGHLEWLACDAAQRRGNSAPRWYENATGELWYSQRTIELHTNAMPSNHCRIFQSYAVLHRLGRHSLDKALGLLMPHCPQTIPGSLLDPNFSSMWSRRWALHVLFCRSVHQTEKGELLDPTERWLNSVFPCDVLPSLFLSNHCHSPLMNASPLFWLAGRWGRGLPCCRRT